MRWVSILLAVVLIPLSIWWFKVCREPRLEELQNQKKEPFFPKMKTACQNGTFIKLVLVIFTLAMGFNFVGLLNYYISIFYLYAGDKVAAGPLLGINGTIWAVTGLVAVFPLNWISKRQGKKKTLGLAILLMAAAQLSKIYCYNPSNPYLVIIPTILLSAGMLMFFTLGSSMLGDICDEDELNTGTRTEGTYYSVYWWFIKLGTAFASFVTGVLISFAQFDETQSKEVDALTGALAKVEEAISSQNAPQEFLREGVTVAEELLPHFRQQKEEISYSAPHYEGLEKTTEQIITNMKTIQGSGRSLEGLEENLPQLKEWAKSLAVQAPTALWRLRVIEIGLPLLLCAFSLLLLKFYPMTEERALEVKKLLEQRKGNQSNEPNR